MKKQTQDEIRQLRDDAASLLASGKTKAAVGCYEKLTQLEPSSGDWPRRAADCYAELGRATDQRKYLLLALRAYGQSGALLKAIAMGKLVQRIFPGDEEAAKALELLETPAPKPRVPFVAAVPMVRVAVEAPAAAPSAAKPAEEPAAEAKQPSAPPSRRPSVRPEALPLSPRQAPVSVALPSVVPSLSPSSILALGVPPDPPGVVSLDADDLIVGSLDPLELSPPELSALDAPSSVAFSLDPDDLVSLEPSPPTLRLQDAALGALAGAQLFSSLAIGQRIRLVETVELVTLAAGELLFRQGDVATAMYVVVEGEVTARVETVIPGGPLDLATLGPGEFFGEIGLLGEQPRQASIVAKTDVTLLAFGRDEMTRLIENDEAFRHAILRFLRERLTETLMLTSPLFQPFGPDDRATLQRLFRFVEVAEGTAMLEAGKKADGLYVLVAGEAVVRKAKGEEDILLGVLGPGDVFGEMSLLQQKPAMASVLARTRCYALRLPDRYFMEVLMTHPVLMEHIATLGATRAEQNAALLASSKPDSVEDAHLTLF
jgi:CRP-like cAMP-binding protein